MTEAQKIAAFDALPVTVVEQVVEYASEADASEAMFAELEAMEERCVDNYRFAFLDDSKAVRAFEAAEAEGCCGSISREILVAGRRAWIGCNYGH